MRKDKHNTDLKEKKSLDKAKTERKNRSIEQEMNDVIEKVTVTAEEVVENNAVCDLEDTETNAEFLLAADGLGITNESSMDQVIDVKADKNYRRTVELFLTWKRRQRQELPSLK